MISISVKIILYDIEKEQKPYCKNRFLEYRIYLFFTICCLIFIYTKETKKRRN